MFGRALVSDDVANWVVDSFAWHLARDAAPLPLIQPTAAFFTATRGSDHDTAQAVLDDILRHLHMETRAFKLQLLPEIADEYAHSYQSMGVVAGTYSHDKDAPVIQYSTKVMRRPIGFINTMAHEVVHDRLAGLEDQLPGGAAAHELATDLHCIISGFGLFQLQDAADMGWSGYLSQPTRAYALELFLSVMDPDARNAAMAFLSSRPRKLMKQAAKMKRRAQDIATLRAACSDT